MAITIDSNLKLSPVDPRDYVAKLAPVALPPLVDLKPLVIEVEDQAAFNSCTANAGCSALELMFNLNGYRVDLSRMYLYYYTRQLSGLAGDAGAYPKDIGAALLHHGTCYESTWGYSGDNIVTEPNTVAVVEAENFKILSYAQIAGDDILSQIKLAVAQNIPVLLTMYVHDGLYKLKGAWQTHKWDYITSTKNPTNGLHEVLVIGYDDTSQRLLVENSWGPNWADGGFFGLPYAAVVPEVVPELWVLTPDTEKTVAYLRTNPPPAVVVDPIVAPVEPAKDYTTLIPKIFAGLVLVGLLIGLFLSNQ